MAAVTRQQAGREVNEDRLDSQQTVQARRMSSHLKPTLELTC